MPGLTYADEMWFDYPDDPQGGRVKIRLVKDGEIQDLTAKLSRQRMVTGEDGKTAMIIESRDDKLSLASELTVKAIVDWENFTDGVPTKEHPKGLPLECTDANKRLFCLEPEFVTKISMLHQEHRRNCEKHQKDLEKNLKK